MADNGVFMEVDAVQAMAKSFDKIGDVMQAVNRGLEIASNLLKASAFFGLVGNMAFAYYLDNLKPHVGKLEAKCHELSGDIDGAVRAFRDGDNSGSKRFQ